jgi:plastocyanin domain-containing protein
MSQSLKNAATVVLSLIVILAVTTQAIADKKKPIRIAISVTETGFEPGNVRVTKGQPVVLVFTRKTDKTCAKEVVIKVSEKQTIEKKLPLGTPVEIATTFPTSGELRYGCGMNMHTGVISVQ